MAATDSGELKTTPLSAGHAALGGRMVPFAGYSMPLHFRDGILKEHLWTRGHAGAFDVSHMGPAFLTLRDRSGDAQADHEAVSALVEPLVCGDIRGLKPGRLRYTLLLNDQGGICDDLIIGRPAEAGLQGSLYIVVNAGTKDTDFAALADAAGSRARLVRADHKALIAVQGPCAVTAVAKILPDVEALSFMSFQAVTFAGETLFVSRSGYTGEDGFEILVPPPAVASFGDKLLNSEDVRPAGLGARDSLRLEAGLPLYGHDLDLGTSPIEAGLDFAVSKRRLAARNFPGAQRIAGEIERGPARRRIGLEVLEGAPAREGAPILDPAGDTIGVVTSGGFSPTLSKPIAMGYVAGDRIEPGVDLAVLVRGAARPARATALPFVPPPHLSPPDQPGRLTKPCDFPRTTNGWSWPERAPRLASPPTPPTNWVMWCSSSCPPQARS